MELTVFRCPNKVYMNSTNMLIHHLVWWPRSVLCLKFNARKEEGHIATSVIGISHLRPSCWAGGETKINLGWESSLCLQPVTLLLTLHYCRVTGAEMTLKSVGKKTIKYSCLPKQKNAFQLFCNNIRHIYSKLQSHALLSFMWNISVLPDQFHILQFANKNSTAYLNRMVGLTFQF